MGDVSGWKSIPVHFQPQQSGIRPLWFLCAGPAGHEHANSVFLELRHTTAGNAGVVCSRHVRWYTHHSYMERARAQSGAIHSWKLRRGTVRSYGARTLLDGGQCESTPHSESREPAGESWIFDPV